MHNLLKIYYFIDEFNREEIQKLHRNIVLIYRNYNRNYNSKLIKKIKNFCLKQNRKFYISNNLKLALNLSLDGLYIPSFNKLCNYKNLSSKKNFELIGSAHNSIQIKNKEKQGCTSIFIAPIFKTKKNDYFLDTTRFNLLAKNTKKRIVALGGINHLNYKKLISVKIDGFASISWIKKNRPKNLGRFLN
tara:strand:+ start:318 stop:884 length:567 start_codon:yes stop_codon:yes gene_type:complete